MTSPPARLASDTERLQRIVDGNDGLTVGERAVAARVCRGWSNQRIAADLDVTVRTVKNRLTVIYQKTGVTTRLQLAVAMNQRGVPERHRPGT